MSVSLKDNPREFYAAFDAANRKCPEKASKKQIGRIPECRPPRLVEPFQL